MKTITSKSGVKLKIYSSAKEMPIGRYADFQKYIAYPDLVPSLHRIKAFIQEGKSDDAEIEIDNAITGVLSHENGFGVHTYAFAVIVAEIDGKQASDTTIDGLNDVIKQIESLELTQFDIESSIEDLKKK